MSLKVLVTRYGAPNSLFRTALITGSGCKQGLHAGEQPAGVLRIFL